VIQLENETFGVEVNTPEAEPAIVKSFAVVADVQTWTTEQKKRVVSGQSGRRVTFRNRSSMQQAGLIDQFGKAGVPFGKRQTGITLPTLGQLVGCRLPLLRPLPIGLCIPITRHGALALPAAECKAYLHRNIVECHPARQFITIQHFSSIFMP
jgi:hypothetical protein